MRAFVVILLLATSVHAQSLADAARRERERREHLKSAVVIKADGSPSEANAKPAAGAAAAEKPKEPAKAGAVDPVKEYNDQLQKLRAKISSLQDQETATQLQINDLNNQIYAPVVDQATKDQAMAVLGEARVNLAAIRLELDQTRKNLEELQLRTSGMQTPVMRTQFLVRYKDVYPGIVQDVIDLFDLEKVVNRNHHRSRLQNAK